MNCARYSQAIKRDLDQWTTVREAEEKERVDDILQLHAMCTPVSVIAKTFGLSQPATRFICQRGWLPRGPLTKTHNEVYR